MKEINGIKIFESVEELNKLDIPDIGFCIVKTGDNIFRYEISKNGISIFAGAYNLETALIVARALKYGVREKRETCKYGTEERYGLDTDYYCSLLEEMFDIYFGCIHHKKNAGTP